VLETFPDPADHVAWVVNGSPAAGEVYGAQGRTSQSDGYGPMPGFGDALSEEEIAAVVRYERVTHGGESAEAGSPAAEAEAEGGNVGGGGAEDTGDDAAPTESGGETDNPNENPTDAGSGTGGTPGA